MSKLLQTKRVIQHKETKLFLKPDGNWTRRLARAADFKCFADILRTCETRGLEKVQLVLKFEQSQYNSRCDVSA